MTAPRLVEVALPLPLHRTFTYAVPEGAPVPPETGRVVVDFRRRRTVGFVVGEADAPPPGVTVKPVLEVVDREPVLSASEQRLAWWMARYYASPPGLVLRLFHPPGGGRVSGPGSASSTAAANPVERLHVLPVGELDPGAEERAAEALARAPAQRRAWDAARALEEPVERAAFCRSAGVSEAAVRALAGRGLVRVEPRPVDRDPWGDGAGLPVSGAEGPLTEAQVGVVAEVRAALAGAGGAFLLQGITGSGKTRVYLEVVDAAVSAGERAIVLVPEIGLAAPVVSRFRRRFGDRVAVLHSRLSAGERADAWRRIHAGDAPVVVGARSALFAPVGRAAVVVVDEEHETAYKQDETPRYLARDVAVARASIEGGVALLGSATPSLESRANAEAGKYRRLELSRRIGERPLPEVEVVDLAETEIVAPGLSAPLAGALEETVGAGDQALLFLNRRGFSSFLQCLDCGWVPECPECGISLTLHRSPRRLLCHYCNHAAKPPGRCAECDGRGLDAQGLGTQQIERAVATRLPEARIARMDLDTTGGKGSHARLYRAMQDRELDILVGTQMIAKGFDLPGVALVGVVSADTALHFPDFRAAERTMQLLIQVAGRTGRGDAPGRVVLQTYLPTHPAVTAAVTHDYEGFYRREVEERRGLRYPPLARVANVVVSGPDEADVVAAARRVAEAARRRLEPGLTLVGPAPCPLERLRGRSRHHMLLKADDPAPLERVMWWLVEHEGALAGASVRLEIDRDPLNLL